jgi:hypothetical protein
MTRAISVAHDCRHLFKGLVTPVVTPRCSDMQRDPSLLMGESESLFPLFVSVDAEDVHAGARLEDRGVYVHLLLQSALSPLVTFILVKWIQKAIAVLEKVALKHASELFAATVDETAATIHFTCLERAYVFVTLGPLELSVSTDLVIAKFTFVA